MLNKDEKAVMVALQEYERRVDEIADYLGRNASIDFDAKRRLQADLKSLKEDIKAANKRGKIHDDGLPQTAAERAYFSAAMLRASANFTVATNSHPIHSNWLRCLIGIGMDIRQFLGQLEQRA